MTLQQCYTALGGDYDDVLGRLRSERLVQKFVLKFVDDGSYKLLLDSITNSNAQEAFRAAHTIKGMCQNLSFTTLGKSAAALTESLRSGSLDGYDKYLPQVKADYEMTCVAIKRYASDPE